MTRKKVALLTVRTTQEWLNTVKTAAQADHTDVSQFVRDAVNERIRQQQFRLAVGQQAANQG